MCVCVCLFQLKLPLKGILNSSTINDISNQEKLFSLDKIEFTHGKGNINFVISLFRVLTHRLPKPSFFARGSILFLGITGSLASKTIT